MAQEYSDLLAAATAALKGTYDTQYQNYYDTQEAVKQKEIGALGERKQYETTSANNNNRNELTQSYISNAIAEKKTPQVLAANGITGGGVESMYADIKRAYENARNSSNRQNNSMLSEILSRYTGLEGDIGSKYGNLYSEKRSALDALLQGAAGTSATNEYTTQLQNDSIAAQALENQRQRDWQAQQNALARAMSAWSSSGGSGSSGFDDGGSSGGVNTGTTTLPKGTSYSNPGATAPGSTTIKSSGSDPYAMSSYIKKDYTPAQAAAIARAARQAGGDSKYKR